VAAIMADSELQSFRADFLQWTGGFEPETEDDIAVYVGTSVPLDLNPEEARDVLRECMRAAAIS
jgi:hypothetical protein